MRILNLYTLYFLLFLVFVLSSFYRVLIPFGDEPDFTVRAPEAFTDRFLFVPYQFLDLNKDDLALTCEVDSQPMSLSVEVQTVECGETFEFILVRLGVQFFLIVSILITLVPLYKNNKTAQSLTLALLWPGIIYYLGVLSVEQVTLFLSLLVFRFWKSRWIVLGVCSLISLIDIGNSLIVWSFVLLSYVSLRVLRVYGIKTVMFLLALILFFCFFVSYEILNVISKFPFIGEKAISMLSLIESGGYAEKYPLILRPVITAMALVFLTPSLIKIPLAYLLVFLALSYSLVKCYSVCNRVRKEVIMHIQYDLVLAIVSIVIVCSFVFMFPNYANAKYYVFILPFIFNALLIFFEFKTILLFIMTINFIVLLNLAGLRYL